MNESLKKESFTRWWEFYVVRYAMGTVVGAIVFYLLCKGNTILQPLLFETGTAASSNKGSPVPISLDGSRLTLLAAYGLVYCYIASAPILVFHAGRFLLRLDTTKSTKAKWIAWCLSLPFVTSVVSCWYLVATTSNQVTMLVSSVFFLVCVLWLEGIVVYRTLVHSIDLYQFYVGLSERRKTTDGEIVESYRHLREHGNSFFIVFLEIALAIVLFGTGMLASKLTGASNATTGECVAYIVVLVLWILPAVLVWVIATVLERRFADNGGK